MLDNLLLITAGDTPYRNTLILNAELAHVAQIHRWASRLLLLRCHP
jgi:hypothetical protein